MSVNLFHDITSGDDDSVVKRNERVPMKDSNVRKFSAKYQHLGQHKHT